MLVLVCICGVSSAVDDLPWICLGAVIVFYSDTCCDVLFSAHVIRRCSVLFCFCPPGFLVEAACGYEVTPVAVKIDVQLQPQSCTTCTSHLGFVVYL